MGVVRNFNFGLQVNGSKSQPADDKSSLNGAWPGSRHPFLRFLDLGHIFGADEARHLKFGS